MPSIQITCVTPDRPARPGRAATARSGPPGDGLAGLYSAGPDHLVAADPRIDHAEVRPRGTQPPGQHVRPTVVAVQGGAVPSVMLSPKHTTSRVSGGGLHVQRIEEEPARRAVRERAFVLQLAQRAGALAR